jgi:ATP-dependent Lon protease
MQSKPTEGEETLIIPLFDIVLYPDSRTRFQVDSSTAGPVVSMMEESGEAYALGLTVRDGTRPSGENPESWYRTGTLLHIEKIQHSEDGYQVLVHVLRRVSTVSFKERDGHLFATWVARESLDDLEDELRERILADIRTTVQEISSRFPGSEQFVQPIREMTSADQVMGYVMPFLPVTLAEKQALLETDSIRERNIAFLDLLVRVRDEIAIRIEMARKVSDKINKSNREAMLREQLKVIQEELNESEGQQPDGGYRERIAASKMPDEVRKKALAEVKKLETGGSHNHESSILRNYLDLLLELPWATEDKRQIDIVQARLVLEKHHNGLEKVKERIIQHLAVMKLKQEKQGSILLLAGPPGTGKTSLGKSIAEALGREYVRISLGGVRDEAEIRGHRRTYVGALPGRIIQGIRRAGTKNPVFILDEIDKMAVSYAGDPASALLEVLDPEQNSTFSDHYLEVPYDLSDVLFIATANSLATIPAPLLDRLELIEIPGYTKNEKFAIAKDHLLPDVLADHGLDPDRMKVDDEAIRTIIDTYTREAGVRGLKKQLEKAARYASEKIVSGEDQPSLVVTCDNLVHILGREPVRKEVARKESVPGVVTGLAWTPVGGEILFVECSSMPGKGNLTLTGQLGDVMKESATISLSLLRSRLAGTGSEFCFSTTDIHIHVPAGATPKDGPSAGVTLFTALASLVTGRTVDPHLAMTGELTLSGAVLPVGGIREKVLAAHRAGIKTVVLPKENERDLEEVAGDVREDLSFISVETVDDVIRVALGTVIAPKVLVQTGTAVAPLRDL